MDALRAVGEAAGLAWAEMRVHAGAEGAISAPAAVEQRSISGRARGVLDIALLMNKLGLAATPLLPVLGVRWAAAEGESVEGESGSG